MNVALFFFGFLATAVVGVRMLASFEVELTDRIGAEAFLFLLCVVTSVISALLLLLSAGRFNRYSGGLAGLVGGVAAAGTFCAAVGTIYLGADLAFSVILSLLLPSLTAFAWPLLTGEARPFELP